MSVYFIRDRDLIKIGFSIDVERRVHTIIHGLHNAGEFLGCMPGDRALEAHFHKMFDAYREYGEWFRVNDRLLRLIEELTTPAFPEKEKFATSDRLRLQEERYAEEGADFLRVALADLPADQRTFGTLEKTTSIPADRLEAIYMGRVCPITAGEYVILRMIHDAFLGLTPADFEDAKAEGRRWAEERIAKGRREAFDGYEDGDPDGLA